MSTITSTSTATDLAAHLRDELGERILDATVAYDQATILVDPEAWPQVARFCKQSLGMTFFDWLGGVDEREDGFSVVARVYNHISRQGVLLKCMVPGGRDTPVVPTLTNVYRGANWHERETYDMFGIGFEGHPGLLPRLLTVENFEGWPLRKEFLLTSREVKPWPGAKEPGGDDDGDAPKAKAAPAPGVDPNDRAAAAKAKAERAKAKAAEARKRKAEEKAAALAPEGAAENDPTNAERDGGTGTIEPGDPELQGTPGVADEGVTDLEDSTARPSVPDDPAGGGSQDGSTTDLADAESAGDDSGDAPDTTEEGTSDE